MKRRTRAAVLYMTGTGNTADAARAIAGELSRDGWAVKSAEQFAALEPALFALEGMPAVRGLIARSWTVRFPRYRHPGFRPVRRQTAD